MTFANRNEQWKHDQDGLEIIKEIPALADKAFKDIDPGDVERLKWAGIYAQRPRDGHFLVRVKLPSGQLTAEQAEVLANLAAEYGKGEIQITIRQAVQIHNITLRDAIDILPRLSAVGLSSVEACGDVPRTILGNPLAGVDAEELLDTRPIVEEVFQFFLGNRAFSNLPRKFKISISANPHDAGFARIDTLLQEEIFRTYPLKPGFFTGYASLCTGNAYCNFAPIETKHRLHALTAALDAAFPEVGQPLRVNLTGCFHACAQPQVADIGLTGGRARVGEETVPVYTVMVGGHLGKDAAFAAPLAGRVADAKLDACVKALVQQYLDLREADEPFYATVARTGRDAWQPVVDQYAIG